MMVLTHPSQDGMVCVLRKGISGRESVVNHMLRSIDDSDRWHGAEQYG